MTPTMVINTVSVNSTVLDPIFNTILSFYSQSFLVLLIALVPQHLCSMVPFKMIMPSLQSTFPDGS